MWAAASPWVRERTMQVMYYREVVSCTAAAKAVIDATGALALDLSDDPDYRRVEDTAANPDRFDDRPIAHMTSEFVEALKGLRKINAVQTQALLTIRKVHRGDTEHSSLLEFLCSTKLREQFEEFANIARSFGNSNADGETITFLTKVRAGLQDLLTLRLRAKVVGGARIRLAELMHACAKIQGDTFPDEMEHCYEQLTNLRELEAKAAGELFHQISLVLPLFFCSCTLADRATALGGRRCDLPSSPRGVASQKKVASADQF
jgi:hypothetical protein